MPSATLATRLHTARCAKGLTFRELAKLCQVDAAWLNRLETGERQNISLQAAIRIADALHVSLDYLAAHRVRHDAEVPTQAL